MINKRRLFDFILIVLVGIFLLIRFVASERNYDSSQMIKIKNLTHSKLNVSFIDKEKYDFNNYVIIEEFLFDKNGDIINYWSKKRMITLLPNGDIIASSAKKIGRYDWDDNIIWEKNITVHHDTELTGHGTVLTVTKEVQIYQNRSVEFDVILELDLETGKEVYNYSTWEHFKEIKKYYEPIELDLDSSHYIKPLEGVYHENYPGDYDYFHLNSVSVIGENKNNKDFRFKKGNWLINFREIDLTLILDEESKEIVWSYGPGEVQKQHNPLMLKNGDIIIYDNGEKGKRNNTRIIEIDPITKEIVWEYDGDFFAEIVGTAQRLENGNTMITHGTAANVFEITSEGEKVWEFWTPNQHEKKPEPSSYVYRAESYPKEYVDSVVRKVKRDRFWKSLFLV